MKIISTNKGETREVSYRGKTVKTGIYKSPAPAGIFLEKHDVKDDSVVDRRYHGGTDKACYLYSYNVYDYWKNIYPDLHWQYGMFGENLTVKDLDETILNIGNEYKLGEAVVQVSQPRQPCFKLGLRMESRTILKRFIHTTYCGTYVRVLQPGLVKPEDELVLIKEHAANPTIADAFYALYQESTNKNLIERLLHCETLAQSCKDDLLKKWH